MQFGVGHRDDSATPKPQLRHLTGRPYDWRQSVTLTGLHRVALAPTPPPPAPTASAQVLAQLFRRERESKRAEEEAREVEGPREEEDEGSKEAESTTHCKIVGTVGRDSINFIFN